MFNLGLRLNSFLLCPRVTESALGHHDQIHLRVNEDYGKEKREKFWVRKLIIIMMIMMIKIL